MCTCTIHVYMYNTCVHVQYMCTCTIHVYMYNTCVHVQYMCTCTIHVYMYNTCVHVQYMCTCTIHVYMYNTCVHVFNKHCKFRGSTMNVLVATFVSTAEFINTNQCLCILLYAQVFCTLLVCIITLIYYHISTVHSSVLSICSCIPEFILLPPGMLSWQDKDLRLLLNALVRNVRVGQVEGHTPCIMAHLIFMCLRYPDHCHKENQATDLLQGVIKGIKDVCRVSVME